MGFELMTSTTPTYSTKTPPQKKNNKKQKKKTKKKNKNKKNTIKCKTKNSNNNNVRRCYIYRTVSHVFCVSSLFCSAFLVLQSSRCGREGLVALLLLFSWNCSFPYPHGAAGWSAVCGCGISWSIISH